MASGIQLILFFSTIGEAVFVKKTALPDKDGVNWQIQLKKSEKRSKRNQFNNHLDFPHLKLLISNLILPLKMLWTDFGLELILWTLNPSTLR